MALGVHGFTGTVLEIEAVAFPNHASGAGKMRFNETAGSMARDSVFVAAAVLRWLARVDIQNYDLHLNVIGGGNINGPSAGAAIFVAIFSAVRGLAVKQDCAITGELSLQGQLKPVGGLTEKVYGARLAGIKKVVVPEENKDDIGCRFPDMKIIPARIFTICCPTSSTVMPCKA
jgi:predicted ATP-dependent protease